MRNGLRRPFSSRSPSSSLSCSPPLASLPLRAEANSCKDITFRRVSICDGGVAKELRALHDKTSSNEPWIKQQVPGTGYILAGPAGASRAHWQLSPPPLLRDLFLNGADNSKSYWKLLMAESPEPLDAAVVVVLLSGGRAALGVLRGDFGTAGTLKHRSRRVSMLEAHKVITTYAVRGGSKQGTGRFQLFDDMRKDGNPSRSEGAKLRRYCAIRLFEKINSKLTEWRDMRVGGAWPPLAVYFAGDTRLKRLLLECKKPECPLMTQKRKTVAKGMGQPKWLALHGRYAQATPSLEALEHVARHLLAAEIARTLDPPTDCEPVAAAGAGLAGADISRW